MKQVLIVCFFLFSSASFGAKQLSAHVHGSVGVDIAADGKQVLIMLKSPSDSFLGFEYKAKSKKEKAFLGISFFVVLIGFLSVLISLYMSLNERQREMAILRSIGVSASKITGLLITEATFLSVIGCLTGFVLQYLLLFAVNPILEAQYSIFIPLNAPTLRDGIVILFFMGLGPISGLIPAIKAYKTSLHNGLLIK